ncbi:MAG TPA: galactose oxidase-like domain-containing protein [Gemmatimonadales bacterium]|nr:galactose oxidase-like domain-containing protein [Gemmatimonadales bacterium]
MSNPRQRASAVGALALLLSTAFALAIHACGGSPIPTDPGTSPPANDHPSAGEPSSATPPVDASKLKLSYLCDTKFRATNANAVAVPLSYTVEGSSESGKLTLAARINDSTPSDTVFATKATGTVRLTWRDSTVATAANGRRSCESAPPPPPAPPPTGPETTTGSWSAPFAWPIVAVHLILLPTGKVLSFGGEGDPQLWDPTTGAFTPKPSPSLVFCAGHTLLADGRVLVAGGHISSGRGLPNTNIFDPYTEQWVVEPPMHHGRWYPTLTTLANGNVLAVSGEDQNGILVPTAELWTGSGWTELPGTHRLIPDYPRLFLAPNGDVFYVGQQPTSGYYSASGSGSWTPTTSTRFGAPRDYGSAVMYEPGKILLVGGGRPPTASAEVIDLNDQAATWRSVASMAHPRRHLNATVLPDGTVLVTGGLSRGDTSAAGFNDLSSAVFAAELWDPHTEQWTTLASSSVPRGYHATTLLLPDGRILHTGSGDTDNAPRQLNAEIFAPPYLFKGARPTIASAPRDVSYGQSFTIGTPDASGIARVTLIRLSAVTHAFNMNQRFLELAITGRNAGSVTVTAPDRATTAPPGHYMLFVLDQQGVPSVARIVHVQ